MKFRLAFICLVLFTTISCLKSKTDGIIVVDATTFEQKMNKEEVQLVDVRTPEEFAEGHLANAVNININAADFETKIASLNKEKPVLVYCKSGGRSGKACGQLETMGFKDITDLDGGITSWKGSGKPIEN